MKTFQSPAELFDYVGQEVGVSEWFEITQERVDTFAEATDDRQWIHIDPERAATGPYGTTVAHGYLTLSLLAPLMNEVYEVKGRKMGVNYGRFCRRSRRWRSARVECHSRTGRQR